jgi:hypothetical protein
MTKKESGLKKPQRVRLFLSMAVRRYLVIQNSYRRTGWANERLIAWQSATAPAKGRARRCFATFLLRSESLGLQEPAHAAERDADIVVVSP